MAKVSIFGALTNIQILLFTFFKGQLAGEDSDGNKYYRGKARAGQGRERRWVIYKGETEASHVPPEWHGWLHYQTDELPAKQNARRRPWQKPHQANPTGTDAAYLPPGHAKRGGQRDAATADYVAWRPPS